MAYSLFGERPDAAAIPSVNPFRAFARWAGEARAKRAQRIALATLLEYDEAMLCDLGISRHDVIAALQYPSGRAAGVLVTSRARASRDWRSRS